MQSASIVALAVILGFSFNHLRSEKLPLVSGGKAGSSASDPLGGGLRISVEEAESMFLAQAALFLDTRSETLYEMGHIQGARSLPWGDFDERMEETIQGVDEDTFIITYCDGTDCNSSEHVAVALLEAGFMNVHVLFDGWMLWNQRNLSVETGGTPSVE